MYAADNPIEPIQPLGGPEGLPWLQRPAAATPRRAA